MAEIGEGNSVSKVNPAPNVVPSGDRPPIPQEGKNKPQGDNLKKTEADYLGNTPPRLDQGKYIDKQG